MQGYDSGLSSTVALSAGNARICFSRREATHLYHPRERAPRALLMWYPYLLRLWPCYKSYLTKPEFAQWKVGRTTCGPVSTLQVMLARRTLDVTEPDKPCTGKAHDCTPRPMAAIAAALSQHKRWSLMRLWPATPRWWRTLQVTTMGKAGQAPNAGVASVALYAHRDDFVG